MIDRRFWLGKAAALCCLATLAGCGVTGRGTTTPQFEGEVVVGANLELSGPAAALGSIHQRALQIAVGQINELGIRVAGKPKKIRLVVRDNGSDPVKAAALTKDMVNVDHVVAIVGAGTSPVSLSVITASAELRIPTVTLAASDALVNPVDERKYAFKVTPNLPDFGAALIENAQRLGARRVGLLTASSTYGDLVTQAMSPAIAAQVGAGMSLVKVERFNEDGSNLADRLPKLLEAKPDTVILGALMPGIGRAVSALRKSGYQGKIFLDPAAGADELLSGATRIDAEGMYMVHPAVLDPTSIANTPAGLAQNEFRKRYVQAHNFFSGLAPLSFDALRLITQAVAAAGRTEGPAVRDALERATYDGIGGNYVFTPQYHGGMRPDTLVLFVVRNGGWSRAT